MPDTFAEVKGFGKPINPETDEYNSYTVRIGRRTGKYEHSETIVKQRFDGPADGKSARMRAEEFAADAEAQIAAQEKKSVPPVAADPGAKVATKKKGGK